MDRTLLVRESGEVGFLELERGVSSAAGSRLGHRASSTNMSLTSVVLDSITEAAFAANVAQPSAASRPFGARSRSRASMEGG